MVFHPVDTISKRLMSNKQRFAFGSVNSVVFRDHANAPIGKRLLSLFPGLGYAAGYSASTRRWTMLTASEILQRICAHSRTRGQL